MTNEGKETDYKRRSGRSWRLLVHRRVRKGEQMYGAAHHVSSFPMKRHPEIEQRLRPEDRTQYLELPFTEFDELVVDEWCHIEGMDTNVWWMDIAGVCLWVTTDRDGKPRKVSVYSPGSYYDPRPDCEYHIDEHRIDGPRTA